MTEKKEASSYIIEGIRMARAALNPDAHPYSNVGATIRHPQKGWTVNAHNFLPSPLAAHFHEDEKIGDASMYVHAEMAANYRALQSGHACDGADKFLTAHSCPNCMKGDIEVGVRAIYFDHAARDQFYGKERSGYFELSKIFASHAGVSLYEVNLDDQSMVLLNEPREHLWIPDECPVIQIDDPDDFIPFDLYCMEADVPHAMAHCQRKDGMKVQILAMTHPVLGFSHREAFEETMHRQTKYSYYQDACNRLLMYAARHGLQLVDQEIYVSHIPTSREQVNMVGAGIKTLRVLNQDFGRDDASLKAIDQLSSKGILRLKSVSRSNSSSSGYDSAILVP